MIFSVCDQVVVRDDWSEVVDVRFGTNARIRAIVSVAVFIIFDDVCPGVSVTVGVYIYPAVDAVVVEVI